MQPIAQTLLFIIDICWFIVILQFVMSWLVAFDVVNTRQRFVAQLWYGLERLTRPVYDPIRRFMPDLGGIDLSPLVVLIGLFFLEQVIVTYLLGSPVVG